MVSAKYIGDGCYVLDGLSTDRKPLNYRNGTVFREIDTGKSYRYDGENRKWPVNSSGGGGDEDIATEADIQGIIDNIYA